MTIICIWLARKILLLIEEVFCPLINVTTVSLRSRLKIHRCQICLEKERLSVVARITQNGDYYFLRIERAIILAHDCKNITFVTNFDYLDTVDSEFLCRLSKYLFLDRIVWISDRNIPTVSMGIQCRAEEVGGRGTFPPISRDIIERKSTNGPDYQEEKISGSLQKVLLSSLSNDCTKLLLTDFRFRR